MNIQPEIKNTFSQKEKILEILKKTYCRLQPSQIQGVGVFAIRNIPKGINPFPDSRPFSWSEFYLSELKTLDPEIIKMIEAFFVVEKDKNVLIPEFGLNGMDISFFVNHSENPNLSTIDEGFTFVAIRNIKKGEELSVSYKTYA